VIVGASLLVVPVGLYWYYALNVVPTFSTSLTSDWNQSLTGLLSLYAQASQITPIVSLAGFVLFAVFSFWVSSRKLPIGQRMFHADGVFLMNVLVALLFGPRSTIYPYVWVILPLALFLSALLMEQVKLEYFTLVCFATFLLNSVLSPEFLDPTMLRMFPLAVIGNLMLIVSLILIYVRPTTIIRRVKITR
jgi:membrane-associated HD superfamily phosphohydrolase